MLLDVFKKLDQLFAEIPSFPMQGVSWRFELNRAGQKLVIPVS
jgi:hypothetical protein